jgi:hypothetical protein
MPPGREGHAPGAADSAVPQLLEIVRLGFYANQPKAHFFRDRRMLLYALTWPAGWLDSRGLPCSPQRYHALVAERLKAISAHGDPSCYGAFFPAYLLKCLQDWFQYHGDDLYDELKHVRNALHRILGSLDFASEAQVHARHVEMLAATHRLLHAQRKRHVVPNPGQMSLF